MNYHDFNMSILITLQRYSWGSLLLLFALSTALYTLGSPLAGAIAFWGVVVLLAASVAKVIIMAEQFRRTRLYRYWLLCYTLVVILLLMVFVKRYMT